MLKALLSSKEGTLWWRHLNADGSVGEWYTDAEMAEHQRQYREIKENLAAKILNRAFERRN